MKYKMRVVNIIVKIINAQRGQGMPTVQSKLTVVVLDTQPRCFGS